MKEQLISFETAKLAKEKGFNVKVWDYYSTHDDEGNKNIILDCEIESGDWNFSKLGYLRHKEEILYSAPTQSLLQKWLREEHKEHIRVTYMSLSKDYCISLTIRSMGWRGFKTYEEALEKGLQESLKLI